ncbi:MAG: hypothetical protein IJ730_02045 [Alphaproteobacteria bacterium]|nr:hypothetical protein [Alphaproteobacteria bacterium]
MLKKLYLFGSVIGFTILGIPAFCSNSILNTQEENEEENFYSFRKNTIYKNTTYSENSIPSGHMDDIENTRLPELLFSFSSPTKLPGHSHRYGTTNPKIQVQNNYHSNPFFKKLPILQMSVTQSLQISVTKPLQTFTIQQQPTMLLQECLQRQKPIELTKSEQEKLTDLKRKNHEKKEKEEELIKSMIKNGMVDTSAIPSDNNSTETMSTTDSEEMSDSDSCKTDSDFNEEIYDDYNQQSVNDFVLS